MKLTIDNWTGNRNNGIETEITYNEAAIDALKTLNGQHITQLIASDEKGFLLIGGGPELYVVSYIVGDNETSYNLVNNQPSDPDEEIALVTGGQKGLFPAKICTSFEQAAAALKYYVTTANMNPDQTWEEE